ncbi:hypothetical protein QBC46DRAFT_402638 [Diplogelasinospora grovesii]|uniref:RGS domain-containing protein n=1 Tax=Diplogelasinospora grovesii TaxID=303347 RepID=A0AAN6NJI4_9PEZI|nr:hypothetical protein QBC46DRAFT_402638 [Diplogelasinospora grovesii]
MTRGARLRRQSPTFLSPSPSPRETSPQPSSVYEDDDDGHSIMTTSRPASMALPSGMASPPSLQEILSSTAPPPYTLSAFMAFLSQNHCLETLEFTMHAERYRATYAEIVAGQQPNWIRDGSEHLCSMWQKLMHTYILPYGPREVNLPSHVRDRLLSLPPTPVPPHPSELDEAVRIVYELMNDSVLGPFLESVAMSYAQPLEEVDEEHSHEHRQGRSRLRISKDQSSSSSATEESSRSPKSGFLPLLNIGRSNEHGTRSASSLTDIVEGGLSDDNGSSASPSGTEPMTPPTTPPTSDWAFSTSPGSLQRAISAHNSGWKKMGARLGLGGKKSRSKRSHTTSATSAGADSEIVSVISIEKTQTADQTQMPTRNLSEWEEPHPGQRLSYPMHRQEGWGGNEQQSVSTGACRSGMAAKGYAPYPNRGGRHAGGGTRRLARPRVRTATLRPLRIPAKVLEESVVRTPTSVTSNSTTSSNVPMLHHQTPQRYSTTDSDSEGQTDSGRGEQMNLTGENTVGIIEAMPPSELASSGLYLSDLSNHLNIAFGDREQRAGCCDGVDDPSVACVGGPEIYAHAVGLDQDLYGWEAELDKKLQMSDAGVCEDYISRFQYRRAGGARRSLLHRVFNLGQDRDT